MAAKLSFEDRVARMKMEGEFEAIIIQYNIRKAQEEKEDAMVEVYRLQQLIVGHDQHIVQLQSELDQSRRIYAEEISKIQREERAEHIRARAELAKTVREEKPPAKLLAPPHTQVVPCFVDHGWDYADHRVGECSHFLALSNQQRTNLMLRQRRCYGCFLPKSVVNHTAAECEHLRYCDHFKSDGHHQLLCGSREMYDSLLPRPSVSRW
jgi:hypothetical protein